MNNYFEILRIVFLVALSFFLYQVIRALNRDVNPVKEEKPRPARAKLFVSETGSLPGLEKGKSYVIHRECSIGRNGENTVAIDDPFLSNFHAVIARRGGSYHLSDLESKNGTFLNGDRVDEEIPLKSGDVIAIGEVKFKFELI